MLLRGVAILRMLLLLLLLWHSLVGVKIGIVPALIEVLMPHVHVHRRG